MKRDKSVTVTRDIRVTSQVPRHVTSGVTKRVSHATTTTPHHTMFVVAASCGCSNYSFHPSNGDLDALPRISPTCRTRRMDELDKRAGVMA